MGDRNIDRKRKNSMAWFGWHYIMQKSNCTDWFYDFQLMHNIFDWVSLDADRLIDR